MNLNRLCLSQDDIESIAVAAMFAEPDCEHAALAFREMGGSLRLLHFVIDGTVHAGDYEEKYLLVAPNLLRSSAIVLAEICEQLAQNPRLFRSHYDFGADPNARFDIGNGRCDLITTEPGTGLTCSTFVAAMFNGIRRPLVDITTWQARPSDRQRHLYLLDVLRQHRQADRARVLQDRVDRIRVSPLEVAGAALEDELPAPFQACCKNAPVIKEILFRKNKAHPGESIHFIPFISTQDQPPESKLSRLLPAKIARRAMTLGAQLLAPFIQAAVHWWNRRNP